MFLLHEGAFDARQDASKLAFSCRPRRLEGKGEQKYFVDDRSDLFRFSLRPPHDGAGGRTDHRAPI